MKTTLIIALAVLACTSTGAAAPDRKAVVKQSSPQDNASRVMLELADGTECKLSGTLYRESRRGESDIFPRTEWILDISQKTCPGNSGTVATSVKWETRLIKAPRAGDSLSVPGRL